MIKSILKNSWVFSLVCCIASGYFGFFDVLYGLQVRLVNNVRFIVNPFAYKANLTERFNTMQASVFTTLPHGVSDGNSNIGYFGYIPYPMVFLAEKYSPMPVYTSFAASTLPLSDLNVTKLQELPGWLLVNYTTIDSRYIQQDDPWQQFYIARNFEFMQMTEYGALLERVKKNRQYRVLDFAHSERCNVPCSIPIPARKAIVVKFLPYHSNAISRAFQPFFRLRLDFEDRQTKEYSMSYTSAQVGLFANVLSMKYAYPKLIEPDDSRIVKMTVSCSPRFVCPVTIQYSLEEIVYDD